MKKILAVLLVAICSARAEYTVNVYNGGPTNGPDLILYSDGIYNLYTPGGGSIIYSGAFNDGDAFYTYSPGQWLASAWIESAFDFYGFSVKGSTRAYFYSSWLHQNVFFGAKTISETWDSVADAIANPVSIIFDTLKETPPPVSVSYPVTVTNGVTFTVPGSDKLFYEDKVTVVYTNTFTFSPMVVPVPTIGPFNGDTISNPPVQLPAEYPAGDTWTNDFNPINSVPLPFNITP